MNSKNWHSGSLKDLTKELGADITSGLSTKEVSDRKLNVGPNVLPRGKVVHWWEMLFEQFKNPLIIILLIAALITFLLDEKLDTLVIMLAVTVNIAISFWQEFRSNNIFEKLQKLITITTRVKRNGKLYEVNSEDLVPGDIILLYSGVKIPADARLISADDLEVNEALLTGESVPVKKKVEDGISANTALADRVNMVYTGTTVEKGTAEAVVVAIGSHTELGQIALLTTNVTDQKTPLQERLANLGKKITIFVVILAIIIFAVGIFEQGKLTGAKFVEMFTLAVAVAVAAIPEGLPAALSIVLAVASQKILKKKGLVKTLIGAETLGSTTVICTDKTGTLTKGVMTVESVHHVKDEKKAALIMAFSNEAEIIEGGKVSGETTDKAKLEYYLEHGGNLKEDLAATPRLAILPFNSEDKFIAAFHKLENGYAGMYVSGAPEKLLQVSTCDEAEKKEISEEILELAGKGFRLIGLFERKLSPLLGLNFKKQESLRSAVTQLEFVGIAAIRDPIRADVNESMALVRGAGIRVIMITGDHKLTARAIGDELKFRTGDKNIVDGIELDNLSKEELRKRIVDIDIISRANPSHKMLIIEALRANGEVVAMTGDGVNDAPALRSSDIGIALGSGTDVTKEASDLVLVDDSFSTIVAAIRQGRIAFDNIRKVTIFALTDSFTEVIIILTSLIMGLPYLAITAVQILWANLIEDGLPALSLAFDPGEKDIMRRMPFKRVEPIINRLGLYIIGLVGIVSDFVLVGLFIWLAKFSGYDVLHIQTIMFAALGMDTLIFIFSIKTLHKSAFSREALNNKYLLIAVGVGFVLMFSAIYVPFLNTLLGTMPLGIFALSLALGTGVFRLIFIEVVKAYMRKKEYFKMHHTTVVKWDHRV
ncbi:MAG: HAD-IC family P-type ATPase [Patescibacteria group bacterium]